MISWSYHRERLVQLQSDWIIDLDEIGYSKHSNDVIGWAGQDLLHIGYDR